jgi:hypothetical protein
LPTAQWYVLPEKVTVMFAPACAVPQTGTATPDCMIIPSLINADVFSCILAVFPICFFYRKRKLIRARRSLVLSFFCAHNSFAFFLYLFYGHSVNKPGNGLQVSVTAIVKHNIANNIFINIKVNCR